jgi:Domain of unknown function (DUF4190)
MSAPYYPKAPGYPEPPVPRTNPFAVAALVCGIAQFFVLPGVGTVLALVFGYTARGQIRRTGEDGDGLATAGIILGWVGVVLVILVIVAFIALVALINSAWQGG